MTKIELQRYNDFLLKHLELTRKKVIRPIYRGDSLKNLCDKLGVYYNYDTTDLKLVLDRLFMVGEKARRFHTDEVNFTVDQTSDYVFEKIMSYFKSSLKSKNTSTLYFFNRNVGLKNFFSDRNNKHLFLSIINNASERERFAIRNYYLILLHQLAAINYKNKSHFVSTSKDYAIAESFSNNNQDSNKIILHCWQPIQMERNTVKKYNLPMYNFGPYSYQKEFSILGGILPHFIMGMENKRTNEFFPNINIFKTDITDEIFLSGLDIDQSNFDNIRNQTNYNRTLVTDGTNIWEE